jgi:PAS domain S-box-containing protein
MPFDVPTLAEETQRLLLNHCACWIQQAGGIIYSSPAFAVLCGLLPQALCAQPDQWLEQVPEAMRPTPSPESFWEMFLTTPQGEPRFLRVHPHSFNDGQVLCLVTDMTGQRQAEQSLRDRELFWQALFKNARDGVALLDAQGRLLYISDSIVDVHGFAAHERVGEFTFDRIHPDDLSLARAVFAHATQDTERKVWRAEARSLHKDGGWRWIDCTVQNLLNEPAIQAIVVNYRDIHAAKQAQTQEQQQREQLETLINTVDGIVWEAEPSPLRFTFVSEQAKRLLGYPLTAWRELGFWESLLDPEQAQSVIAECQTQAQLGKSHTLIYRIRHLHGHYIWVRDDVSVIMKEGVVAALRGIMVDVSARYQAEERLRQTLDELEQIMQRSNDFICIVSAEGHFLRVSAASQVILGYAPTELLGRNYLDFVVPQDHAATQAAVEKLSQGTPLPHFENRYIHRDGHLVPIVWSTAWASEEQRFYAIGRDVTQLYAQEAEYQHKERQLKAVSQTIPGIVYQFQRLSNGQYFFPFMSESALIYWGVAAQEMVGREPHEPIFSLTHPADIDGLVASIENSAATMTPWLYKLRIRHKKTQVYKWYQGHSLPHPQPDGSILWIGTIMDIDPLEQVHQELAARDLQLKATLQSMGEGLLVFNHQGKLLLSNPAAEKLIPILPQNWHVLATYIQPLYSPIEVPALLDEVLAGNTRYNLPLRYDQTEILWTFSPLWDTQQHSMGMVATFRNITALRRIAWLQSHEIRRPLANILGLSSLLDLEPDNTESKRLQFLLRQELECLDQVLHQIVETTHQAIHPIT